MTVGILEGPASFRSLKMMAVLKQRLSRRSEKALKEILDKADSNTNGRVELKVYLAILERNGIEMDEEELETFAKLADENGEISKNDLIVHTKASSFWSGSDGLQGRSLRGGSISKVEVMNATDRRHNNSEFAFGLFDKNRDGYISREEFAEVSKKLSPAQIDAVFAKFDTNKDGKLSREEFKNMMEKR